MPRGWYNTVFYRPRRTTLLAAGEVVAAKKIPRYQLVLPARLELATSRLDEQRSLIRMRLAL